MLRGRACSCTHFGLTQDAGMPRRGGRGRVGPWRVGTRRRHVAQPPPTPSLSLTSRCHPPPLRSSGTLWSLKHPLLTPLTSPLPRASIFSPAFSDQTDSNVHPVASIFSEDTRALAIVTSMLGNLDYSWLCGVLPSWLVCCRDDRGVLSPACPRLGAQRVPFYLTSPVGS